MNCRCLPFTVTDFVPEENGVLPHPGEEVAATARSMMLESGRVLAGEACTKADEAARSQREREWQGSMMSASACCTFRGREQKEAEIPT